MKEDLADYGFDIMYWVLCFPMAITANSNFKAIRILGFLLTFPFAITWILTFTPVVFITLSLLIIQTIREI